MGFSGDVNGVSDYQNATAFREATLKFQAANPELAEILNNVGEAGSDEYNEAMRAYVNAVQREMGASESNAQVYDDAQIAKPDMVGENGGGKDGYRITDMETNA